MTMDISLRPISFKDTDNIVKWRSQDFVKNNFIFRNVTKDTHENWMREMVDKQVAYQYIIVVNAKDVGSVFLKDFDAENAKAEFGIFIGDEAFLSKGIGAYATALILKIAFQELKLHKVYLRVLANNQRAIASYTKNGFEQEGLFKDEVRIDERFYDLIFMAKIAKENEKNEKDIICDSLL